MFKGSQSRVDQRRKDLYKRIGIIAAIALPVLAVGAFFGLQSQAAGGPGGGAAGGSGGGCQPDDGSSPGYYDTCTGAAWVWYETSSNSVNLGGGGSTAPTVVTNCATHGGYWLYNFVTHTDTNNPPQNWKQVAGSIAIGRWNSTTTYASVKLGGNMGWFGPSDDPSSWATADGPLTDGAWGAWPEVYEFYSNGRAIYDQAVADGMNYQQAELIGIPPYVVTGPSSYDTSQPLSWASGSHLSWFCAGDSLGTTITPDSFINGLHRGKNNPVEAPRGGTVTYTHQLTRDNTNDPGTGQYWIVETKYPANDGNNPASSSMGTQYNAVPLTDASFSGTNSNINPSYATIPFTIPSDAVNGSIWCQHIEFWAPNDLGGHDSYATRGYPTWDGSSTTRGEVCATVVVPVHTPDSFVDKTPDGQPDGQRGIVYVRPGADFEFEHRIDKSRPDLDGGMGIYEINETTSNGALSQCIWDPLNNGSIMTNANFASSPNPFTPTHPDYNSSTYGNSRIDNDHTLVPCTSDPMDPDGAMYCQNINFWTSIDGNVPQAFDSNKHWGRSEYVCAVVQSPKLKIVKDASKYDLAVGEEFEYTITVTNTNKFIDTIGLIQVTDMLPDGIDFADFDEEDPEAIPLVFSNEMDCSIDPVATPIEEGEEEPAPRSFTCETFNVLDPNEANRFTITVRVKAVGFEDKTEFDNRSFVGGGGDRDCEVGTDLLECSDNVIVRIPKLPEPPKTGVVLGSSTPDSAAEYNYGIIISSAVVALAGMTILGFQAVKRSKRNQ